MISQDTKDQIEKNIWIELDKYFGHQSEQQYERNAAFQIALSLATKYAEKLEEKDKEIESLTTCIIKAENGWAKSQSVTIDLQEFLRKFIAAFDKGSSDDYNLRDEAQLLLSKKWPEIKFADNAQLESRDRELAQLKEIAEKMINYLKDIERCGECPSCSENAGWAITAYIEWCKQNLK